MSWRGLWLLWGLGAITGICSVMFVKAQGWRCAITSLCVGIVAIPGTLYLIMEWLGPAGGG